MMFHDAFIRACSRVMYRKDWSKSKPMIQARNNWDKCPSQILVSTPRRFGKVRALPSADKRNPGEQAVQRERHNHQCHGCLCEHRAQWASTADARVRRASADVLHRHLCRGLGAFLWIGGRRVQVSRCCSTEPSSLSVNFVRFSARSPARRASRKLLERIVEFIRLLDCGDRIQEFNQVCGLYRAPDDIPRSDLVPCVRLRLAGAMQSQKFPQRQNLAHPQLS